MLSLDAGVYGCLASAISAALILRTKPKPPREYGLLEPEYAAALDAADPVSRFRGEFIFPPTNPAAVLRRGKKQSLYLCGNSLGLQPKRTQAYIQEELDKWSKYGVEGHFKTIRPWMTIDETVEGGLSRLLGASPEEVVVMNTLTTNLHLLMVSFYRPTRDRYKIIMEAKAFPSDAYAMQSQAKFHGFDPADAIVEVKPRDGEDLIRTEDILAAIEEHGESVATVMFTGIQYYTGQFFDIPTITKAAHAVGATMGVDLAHATGNVPLKLHDWGVDYACYCSYKYLNSGPGGIAGVFVHERHATDESLPRFAGWWGHRKEDRFQMHHNFKPSPGASGWQLSNPPVWQVASLRASLDIFDEAGMDKLREKSENLTGYLEQLILFSLHDDVRIISPTNRSFRGCQLSLVLSVNVKEVQALLEDEGVIVDVREPFAMRVAPTPLYNSFEDVREFAVVLRRVIDIVKGSKE